MAASWPLSWWEGTHAAGPVFFIPIYSPSTSFTRDTEAHSCLHVVSLSLFWDKGLGKGGISLCKFCPPQHSPIIDSDSAHLQDKSAWRRKEKQCSWCCSFPQPITRERGSPRGTNESHSGMETQHSAGCPWSCWYPWATICTVSFCSPAHTCSGSTEAEFKHGADELCLMCCCSFTDSCWVLMIKINCVLSCLLPS